MTTDEAKAVLEHAIETIAQTSNQSDVQAYWDVFKDFCFRPIDNEGQSVVISCLTADFPISGHAFYVTFKRIIWTLDEDDESVVDQIVCTLACKESSHTQGLSLNFGGEPLSDLEFAQSIDAVEQLLKAQAIHKLIPSNAVVSIA